MTFNSDREYHFGNEWVKFEPLKPVHLEALLKIGLEKGIWTFFDDECLNRTDFEKYFKLALYNREVGKEYPFAIFDKKEKNYVGMTRLYAFDSELRNIKIGHSWIGVPFQGTGINKASKHAIMNFLFEEQGIERIGFGVHAENAQSIAAMKSIGAIKEGVLRSFLRKIDLTDRCDLMLFSITKSDWESTVNKNLSKKYKAYLNPII